MFIKQADIIVCSSIRCRTLVTFFVNTLHISLFNNDLHIPGITIERTKIYQHSFLGIIGIKNIDIFYLYKQSNNADSKIIVNAHESGLQLVHIFQ